jgi:hypothetical protein
MNLALIGILSSRIPPLPADYNLELEVLGTFDAAASFSCNFTRDIYSDSLSCPAPATATQDYGALTAIFGTTTVQAAANRQPSLASVSGVAIFTRNGDSQYVHVYDVGQNGGYTHVFTDVSPGDTLKVQYNEA